MLENIFHLLDIAKEKKFTGEYIAIALGKNKYPETIRETYTLLKKELWHKRK
jgi:hypothetical protein|tara:strand:+ start:227 stop:382 length:156 start_codon:yes stop_codon:yes gene_type:complete